jgi:hypothetical protein
MPKHRSDTWEPLHGQWPDTQLALHPARQFVAGQVCTWRETSVERAAVWDVKTKKIVWRPRNSSTPGSGFGYTW